MHMMSLLIMLLYLSISAFFLLFRSNIVISILFLTALIYVIPSARECMFHTHAKQQIKLSNTELLKFLVLYYGT